MTQTLTAQGAETAEKFGHHLMNYLTHQLAISQDKETLETISTIRKMTMDQLQDYHVIPVPALNENCQIIGFKIRLTKK